MLNSKQRAYLRSLTNTQNSIVQIGKGGVTETLIKQVDETLEARELVKVTVLDNSPNDVREMSEQIASEVSADVVQVIGRKFTIYRAAKKPVIILP